MTDHGLSRGRQVASRETECPLAAQQRSQLSVLGEELTRGYAAKDHGILARQGWVGPGDAVHSLQIAYVMLSLVQPRTHGQLFTCGGRR
jgi:hypothetical protein